MRRIAKTTIVALVLLFMATSNLHAASGTYIDCFYGCSDHKDCINCCNETFSFILSICDAKQDQCEALCPPKNMDCLDNCMHDTDVCLQQDSRDRGRLGPIVGGRGFQAALKGSNRCTHLRPCPLSIPKTSTSAHTSEPLVAI